MAHNRFFRDSRFLTRRRPAPAPERPDDIDWLAEQLRRGDDDPARTRAHLLRLLPLLRPDDPEQRSAQEAVALALQRRPDLIDAPEVAQYLLNTADADAFEALRWRDPLSVVRFTDKLYEYSPPEDDESRHEQKDHMTQHAHVVLRHAYLQFERENDLEKVFRLLQLAPSSVAMSESELFRLRNRVHLYEVTRTLRRRQMLYNYLLVQVALVFVVFPLLFMYAENGALSEKIEDLSGKDLPEERRSRYDYSEALYWAIITGASIGYGDITPHTAIGRIMASILGASGVVTVGVVGGLVITWITPRRLRI